MSKNISGRHRAPRRTIRLGAAALAGTVLVGTALTAVIAASGPATAAIGVTSGVSTVDRTGAGTKPTVVLVHGAFADASGWSQEISFLQHAGYPVIAPANPLRGVASDAEYVRSVLKTVTGPVVLVGHSYGGAVITNAAVGAPNVKALVFISAFVPDKDDSAAQFTDPANYPGSLLSDATLVYRPTTNPAAVSDKNPAGNDVDVYINPASFRAVFAADLPAGKAAVLGASQRGVSGFAYTEKSGAPAWKTIPSWDLVSLDDKAIPPPAQQYMARRAGAHTVAIHSAHDSLISHPDAVDTLIVQAARATS
jgi:pimeloyl-ACP methyl ester carboxylesterase